MSRHILWNKTTGPAHEVCPDLHIRATIEHYIERSKVDGEPHIFVKYWYPEMSNGVVRAHATLDFRNVSNIDILLANLYEDLRTFGSAVPEANLTICKRDTHYFTNWLAQSDVSVMFNQTREGKFMCRRSLDAAGCDGAVTFAIGPQEIKGIRELTVFGEPFSTRKVWKEIRRQAVMKEHFIDFREGSQLHDLLGTNVFVGIWAKNGIFHILNERHVHVTLEEILRASGSIWDGACYEMLQDSEQLNNV